MPICASTDAVIRSTDRPGFDAADVFAGIDRAVKRLTAGSAAALAMIDQALADVAGRGKSGGSCEPEQCAACGATDDGVAELRSLITDHSRWEVIVRGFADKGLIAPLQVDGGGCSWPGSGRRTAVRFNRW